jgi:hypothetical protein
VVSKSAAPKLLLLLLLLLLLRSLLPCRAPRRRGGLPDLAQDAADGQDEAEGA